jgi:hypothetical protein
MEIAEVAGDAAMEVMISAGSRSGRDTQEVLRAGRLSVSESCVVCHMRWVGTG